MAVDFDAQIGEGDEYEVDEDIHDNAESTHMETKQFVFLFIYSKSFAGISN
jgi:hypothetical protein